MVEAVNSKDGQRDPDFAAAIVFPPLMLLSGFLSYILYHDYGAFEPEVLIAYAGLGLVGLAIGYPLAKAGPTNLRAFSIGLLLLVYVDVQFDFFRTVVGFVQVSEGQMFRYMILLLGFFLTFLTILSIRKKLASVVAVLFGTLLVSTVALPLERVRFGSDELPQIGTAAPEKAPLIHLVLDGHIGIDGIPQDVAGGAELRSALEDFYSRWGFRVFNRAYSKYFMTYDSLSNMFNGTASKTKAGLVDITNRYGKSGLSLNENAYFQKIMEKGYYTRIYQSDYLDFCRASNNLEYCYVYSSASPQLIRELDIPLYEKAELIIGSYANDSGIYNAVRAFYRLLSLGIEKVDVQLPEWQRKNYEFSSLGVPAIIQKLDFDISLSSEGRMFFAHLLLPHSPYVWDRQCRLRTDSDTWLSRRHEHENLLTLSTPDYRDSAYQIYFEQAHCLVSLLDALFKSLEANGLLQTATIVVHGDHGSRITIADPVDPELSSADNRDFVDSFSTLLAIRSPSLTPGFDRSMRSIQGLFAEHVLKDSSFQEDGNVLLQTTGVELVPAPMPSF